MPVDLFGPSSVRMLSDVPDVQSLAEEHRRAGLAFVNGVGAGWTSWDAAHWMSGPYRSATRPGAAELKRLPKLLSAVVRDLDRQLRKARDATLALLEQCAHTTARIAFVE